MPTVMLPNGTPVSFTVEEYIAYEAQVRSPFPQAPRAVAGPQKRLGVRGIQHTGPMEFQRTIMVTNRTGDWVTPQGIQATTFCRNRDARVSDTIKRDRSVAKSYGLGTQAQYIIDNYQPGKMKLVYHDRKGNKVGEAL